MTVKRNNILILLTLLIISGAQAQIELAPSCEFSNPDLITQLKSGMVAPFSLWDTKSAYGIMASSTLGPSGKNPFDKPVPVSKKKLTEEEQQEADIAEINAANESSDWNCQYSAYSLRDGDPATAWVEGEDGDGIGEVVLTHLNDTKRPVKIWTGYGKSDALFHANNRPAKVRIYLLATNCARPSQFAISYNALTVIGTKEVLLKDVNAFQDFTLPPVQKTYAPTACDEFVGSNDTMMFMAIEILSVYKGTKYHDTCISEIRN